MNSKLAEAVKLLWERNISESGTAYCHADFLLSEKRIFEMHRDESEGETKGTDLLRSLLDIHGVQSVTVERYKVHVERTKVVDWSAICPEVDKAIYAYVEKALAAGN